MSIYFFKASPLLCFWPIKNSHFDFAEKSERFSQCSLKKNRPCEMVDLTQEKPWVRSTMSNLTGSRPRCGDMAGSTPCLRTKSRHTLVLALSKVRIWSILYFWCRGEVWIRPCRQKCAFLIGLKHKIAEPRCRSGQNWRVTIRRGVDPAVWAKMRIFDRPKT